jgi:outer membrane protein TolC
MKLIALFFSILLCCTSKAQQNIPSLNAEEVLQIVRSYHPIVKQSSIAIEQSKATILNARGAFDPILNTYLVNKTFDGVNYYKNISPEIKVPTWYGIELTAGSDALSGNRIDPTQTTGATSYFGVSVPLAKNLLLDKRRAFLKQSKLYNKMAVVEQRSIINDIAMQAMEAYWQWVRTYQTFLIAKNSVAINEKRLELVRKSYVLGERPAIDTTETIAQLQSFQYMENANWLAFQSAGLELSAYLWKTNDEPYNLPETVIPQSGWENETNINNFQLSLPELESMAAKNHPDLQVYGFKLDILQIEKKLKYQDLLPKLDFTYTQLGKGYNFLNTVTEGPLFRNNYQVGLKLEMPLRFFEGKANYKKAKLKLAETKLDQNQKQLSIQLKIKDYYNTFVTLKKQVALQSNNYANYQRLVTAEETRFFNGESSLFLINSRETKALEALEKLIELKTKYFKTIYALQWSAGLLQ